MRRPYTRSPGLLLIVLLAGGCATAGRQDARPAGPPPAAGPARSAEVGCALCIYGMPDELSCTLAVRLDGHVYPVRGVAMEDLGDPHAPDGLCNTARQARVVGQVEDGVFVARSIELEP